jgi:AraC family transcriptional regulator
VTIAATLAGRQQSLAAAKSETFQVTETHGILLRPQNHYHARSEDLGWSSLFASAQKEAPFWDDFKPVQDHMIVLHLDGPVKVDRVLGKERRSQIIPASGLFILPGGLEFGVGIDGWLETLHIYLRHKVLIEVAAELYRGDPAKVELLPRLGVDDPALARLALCVRDALYEADPAGPLLVDYLAHALATKLLQNHSNVQAAANPSLSGRGLDRRAVARVLDFIAAHLDAPILLADLAAAVGLSVTHFSRQFKASTGMAPHRMVVSMRVERAKMLLAECGQSIAEIALECGFAHQEHLTRVFAMYVGLTPAAFRRSAQS